ncbi:testis-expressed protein 11-like [Oncorhynchus masou masou]|uniref:testis-expressed protein 11-like n=1 Tax=Oncorhynchus masou masou TaxID=90313 RepID=UPI003182C0A2
MEPNLSTDGAQPFYRWSPTFLQMEPNLSSDGANMQEAGRLLLDKCACVSGQEAIEDAERHDPNSIFTQFSVYKIAVLDNNVEEASGAVKAIGTLAQSPVTSEDRLLLAKNADSNHHQSGCSNRSGGVSPLLTYLWEVW